MEGRGGALILMILSSTAVLTGSTKVQYAVECTGQEMVVRVDAEGVEGVALEKWGELPGCETSFQDNQYVLRLPLDNELVCGTTRVKNKLTGETVYYHRVAVTSDHRTVVKLVKCRIAPDNSTIDNIVKRDVLPPEFEEPDFIEITSEVSGTAPIPILNVGVRQNGNLVGGQINVRPGTPLTMEVYLDNLSAGTYGILMNYMEVTDTHDKRETIIFNGCSIDPVLFDNFVTEDGDLVSAKFRAFKFPETNYVLFRGTIDVCLDKCQGIACSNGQIGYGRRRRGVGGRQADPNKIFEITMMTFLKIDEKLNGTRKSSLIIEEDMDGITRMTNKMTDDLPNGMPNSMVAVEQTIESTDDALTWKSSDDYIAVKSSRGNEPAFIYFNNGLKLTSSWYLTIISLVLFLFQ
ncbi:uncharacterized protein qsm isoform X1 [Macrobrachium rosenbergii]|uniref:uncharacterized protein qsm isoform X1 n=2 Tax=Macrobrachium rosenbergii TaxID=79674 RepID=UPI0034D4F22C